MIDTIQTDVSEAALTGAIRGNLCELLRYTGQCNPPEHLQNERFTRWQTPLAHPWFNGVLSASPPREDDEAFVQATIQYFREKQVNVFSWWMEPPLPPSAWQSILNGYGFAFSSFPGGMAVELRALNESSRPLDGFEIHVAADEESLRVWADTFVEGYDLPPEWQGAWLEVWKNLGLDLPVRNYIGYLQGKPVSTSSVYLGRGVAGIYCVATRPDARGKGIGAAITLRPLQEARAMGYRIGILQSSEMGSSVYKRLGFQQVCSIENFYLKLVP